MFHGFDAIGPRSKHQRTHYSAVRATVLTLSCDSDEWLDQPLLAAIQDLTVVPVPLNKASACSPLTFRWDAPH
jgi:hypothetical protein